MRGEAKLQLTHMGQVRGFSPSSPAAGEGRDGVALESATGTESEALFWKLGRFSVVMALLLSLASLPFSTFFEVREVRVEGNSQVSSEEISALVSVPEGTSIFEINRDAILARVSAHPRIRSAAIFPAPPHAIIVRVEERQPFVLLEYQGHSWVLDKEGVVIGQAGDVLPSPVRLQASLPDFPAIVPGKPVPSEGVRHAIAVLLALPEGVEGEITDLVVTQEGLVLRTRDGIRIHLGGWKGIFQRISRLPQVLQAVRSLEVPVESVDLRFRDTLVIRPGANP